MSNSATVTPSTVTRKLSDGSHESMATATRAMRSMEWAGRPVSDRCTIAESPSSPKPPSSDMSPQDVVVAPIHPSTSLVKDALSTTVSNSSGHDDGDGDGVTLGFERVGVGDAVTVAESLTEALAVVLGDGVGVGDGDVDKHSPLLTDTVT